MVLMWPQIKNFADVDIILKKTNKWESLDKSGKYVWHGKAEEVESF